MEKNLKVSVVVATYRHEDYIAHTLESILSQKVDFDYEVLVGEDCSGDGTARIVKEFADKNPGVIIPYIREKNMGMSGNSLDLIFRTQGEYVALIEGDDYWIDENKLQKQVDFLDTHREYVACFGKSIIVDEKDNRLPKREQDSGFIKRSGDYTMQDFEEYMLPGQTATSMYRQETFVRLLRNVIDSKFDMNRFIDRHLVLMMMSEGKLYNSGEEIAAYRYVLKKKSGSWSSKNDYYSYQNTMNYLEGLKELELMGKDLKMKVDFDERRKYEIRKLASSLSKFSKSEETKLKRAMVKDSNNRFYVGFYLTKVFLKKNIKRTAKRILRWNGDKP